MAPYVRGKFDYVGVDETSAGPNTSSFIVVAARTTSQSLANHLPYGSLRKGRDFLRIAQQRAAQGLSVLPSIEEMMAHGLEDFYWARARPGMKFSRPEIEHGIIPHVIVQNGFRPDRTVVLVDAFHTNYQLSKELLIEYFHARGFPIPRKQVEVIGDGDRTVQIINYADIIALTIGASIGNRYRAWLRSWPQIDLGQEVAFDHRRTIPLSEEGRRVLEDVLERSRPTRRSRR